MSYSQKELLSEGVWDKFKGAAKAGLEVAKFAAQTLDPSTYNTLAGAANKVGALNKAVIKASTPLEQYITKQLYQQGWKAVPGTLQELKTPGQSALKSAYNTVVGGGTPKEEKKYLIKVQKLVLNANNKVEVEKESKPDPNDPTKTITGKEIPAKTLIVNSDGQKASSMETAEEKKERLKWEAQMKNGNPVNPSNPSNPVNPPNPVNPAPATPAPTPRTTLRPAPAKRQATP